MRKDCTLSTLGPKKETSAPLITQRHCRYSSALAARPLRISVFTGTAAVENNVTVPVAQCFSVSFEKGKKNSHTVSEIESLIDLYSSKNYIHMLYSLQNFRFLCHKRMSEPCGVANARILSLKNMKH